MKRYITILLLSGLASMPLAQAQGDYNAGLLAGIKAGWNVIQALLQKDNTAYQAAADSWNSLVRTTGDQTYILPNLTIQPEENPTTQTIRPDSQGEPLTEPSHSFDPSVIGSGMGDWKSPI
jgi:hypothetical protein